MENTSKRTERPSTNQYYLDIALAVAKRSTCLRRKYGVVLVKDGVILSTGYNGAAKGKTSCLDTGKCKRENCARYTGYENCISVHAEMNALMSISKSQTKNSKLYIACVGWDEDKQDWIEDFDPLPCPMCSRLITNAEVDWVINRSRSRGV